MRKTKFGKLICLLLTLCLGLALVACGTDPEDKGDLTPGSIMLTPNTMSVQVGKSGAITAALVGLTGEVTWTSSNDSIATVAVTSPEISTQVATVTGVAAGTATITAKVGNKTATCAVTVTGQQQENPPVEEPPVEEPPVEETPVNIQNGEEHDAYVGEKTWIEWHDQNWNGATVEVTTATVGPKSGTVTLSYNVTAGAAVNGEAMQLFYHDPSLTVGSAYMLKMGINASVAGNITINDTVVALESGDNSVEVPFTQVEEGSAWDGKSIGATVRIQFGVRGVGALEAGTFVLSGMQITTLTQIALQTPSFTLSDENVITITDPNTAGVSGYALGLFAEGDENPTITLDVAETGATIDMSRVANGTYTAKLQAKAENVRYTDSDWSTGVELTVENEGGVQYDLNTGFGGAEAAAAPGTWGVWGDQGWCNSTVTFSSATYDNGTISATFTSSGACTFGLQFNYINPNYVAGTVYTFDIVASADMNIQVGSDQAEVIELKAGEKVTLTGLAEAKFYVQVNIANNVGGTITISNVVWAAPAAND